MIYPSIRIEGSILSPELLDRIEELPGQKPSDFGLESSVRVKDEIARAWADAQDYWRIFQRKVEALRPESPATTETRQQWIVPLLGSFGYQLEFYPKGEELNGKTYAISHRVTNRAFAPIHIVGYREPARLDRKPERATVRMSAHAVVQEFLNLNDQLYGLLTDGHVIRLLRDSSRLIKQSYLEFDLDRIFTDGLFADFAVMYRLLHASRLPRMNEEADKSFIERYHQDSLDSGARIRDGLSKAVENAILAFGNGFLAHPANVQLRERLGSGILTAEAYYAALLRLIYRLLFLMVIEERDLIFPLGAAQHQRDTYMRYYSLQRLRQLSEKRHLADKRQHDLWLALLSTFRLFEAAGPGEKLGVKPLAGDLFRADALGDLVSCELSNAVLLNCLRSLGLYEHPDSRQLIRVNYGALNVEEFGSVYEGLLEYEPVVAQDGVALTFGFGRGDDRAATGSHYTPDDLVQPLIRHSLDHLIKERLKAPDPAAALLDLRVADIACGSGHILLAAARRIATELAVVRSGEEQPSPSAFRGALRDVIRTCIYGVDLNPLAVELCKVALWLEAHNPGEPLSFLDHHIKCGNSIVGFVRPEELDEGIPDEAFKALPGDDSAVGKDIRAQNKRERKDRRTMPFTALRQSEIAGIRERWIAMNAMPERTPTEIEAKQVAFRAFSSGGAAWSLMEIAAIPIAQFYTPRTPDHRRNLITDGDFREYWAGHRRPQGPATAHALALSSRKRFFHWFIEFPDIVARGGFDCILGNPPYLGGQGLSGKYGHEFCNYVRCAYAPAGLSDLVVYFVRRIFSLLTPGGFTAFITTNSIKDGDIRKDGLEQIVSQGGDINMAVRGIKWPGRANLVVSLVALHKGAWKGPRSLDGRDVSAISPFFEDSEGTGTPSIISSNQDSMFMGTIWLGDGFLLDQSTRSQLIAEGATNSSIVPILNGQEINSSPDQNPDRWIINLEQFDDLEEAIAAEPELVAHLQQRVLPSRIAQNNATAKKYWWRYYRYNKTCYERLRELGVSFVAARTTKHLAFSRVAGDIMFTDALYVFTTDRWDLFAVVQSTIHEVWARKYSGALKQDLRYSPSKCFETFAFPAGLWQEPASALAEIGERYHEHRRQLMLTLWLGLTDIYNLFHARDLSPEKVARKSKKPLEIAAESYRGLLQLRQLHVELDAAVRDAYGWHELNLGHHFQEVETLPENDRVRFTVSPAARKEILVKLLVENHTQAGAQSMIVPAQTSRRKTQAHDTNSSQTLSFFPRGI